MLWLSHFKFVNDFILSSAFYDVYISLLASTISFVCDAVLAMGIVNQQLYRVFPLLSHLAGILEHWESAILNAGTLGAIRVFFILNIKQRLHVMVIPTTKKLYHSIPRAEKLYQLPEFSETLVFFVFDFVHLATVHIFSFFSRKKIVVDFKRSGFF